MNRFEILTGKKLNKERDKNIDIFHFFGFYRIFLESMGIKNPTFFITEEMIPLYYDIIKDIPLPYYRNDDPIDAFGEINGVKIKLVEMEQYQYRRTVKREVI